MKQKKELLICDCCGKELYKREVYKNDGSYQKDFIEIEDKEVCFNCGGKILEIFFLDQKEKIKESIKNFHNKINPLRMKITEKSFLIDDSELNEIKIDDPEANNENIKKFLKGLKNENNS